MSKNNRRLKCNHCKNEWETKYDLRFVACPSCCLWMEVIKDRSEIINDKLKENSSNKLLKCNNCKYEWVTTSNKLSVACPSCLHWMEIKRDRTEIIKDLEKQTSPNRPNRKSRDPDIVKKMKIKVNFTCQICEKPSFEDKNGNNYVEGHHFIPIEKNGPDSPKNILRFWSK